MSFVVKKLFGWGRRPIRYDRKLMRWLPLRIVY